MMLVAVPIILNEVKTTSGLHPEFTTGYLRSATEVQKNG